MSRLVRGIVAVDGTGWTQALFPDAYLNHRNPVAAGEEILLPGEGLYGLDEVPGIETIYILAANERRADLEEQLRPFFGKEHPAAQGTAYQSIEHPIVVSRGLTGVRPSSKLVRVEGSDVSLSNFIAIDGETEIAMTLWFNHE